MEDWDEQVWKPAPGVAIPAAMLSFTFSRSGGPGGQNVNKLNTKASLHVGMEDLRACLDAGTHTRLGRLAAGRVNAEGNLRIDADSHRSQRANRAACLEILGDLIRRARVRPRRRRKTKPSRGAVERRLESKRQRSQAKRRRRERFD